MRMCQIVICTLSYSIFPHYLINGTVFEKELTKYKMCVLIFSTIFIWNFPISRKNWATYEKMCIVLRVKYLLLMSDFNENWIFSTNIRKIFRYHCSWKSTQWEPSCSMRTDGQTEGQMERQIWKRLILAFRNFPNTLDKGTKTCRSIHAVLQVSYCIRTPQSALPQSETKFSRVMDK
jgi:hypothetical protein